MIQTLLVLILIILIISNRKAVGDFIWVLIACLVAMWGFVSLDSGVIVSIAVFCGISFYVLKNMKN